VSPHYLVKPKCSKIALISTLISTGWGLSVMSLWTGLSVTQTSDAIWLRCDTSFSVFVDFSGCNLFRMLCLPKQFVHHLLPPLQKCSNLRDHGHLYKLSVLWPPNSLNLYPLDYLGHNSATSQEYKTAGREGFDATSDWCMAGVEESVVQNVIDHRRRHLHTCFQPQKDTMNIHCHKN